MLAILFPLGSIVLVSFLSLSLRNERIGRTALVVALLSFLSLFNATKQIDGDWYVYTSDFVELSKVGLWEFIEIGGSSIRITEPAYYAFAFIISRLSGASVAALAIVTSIVIYLTYFFALEKLLSKYSLNRLAAAVCIIFALVAGITFTVSLQLVRQFIAGSILFLYFVLLLEGKGIKAMMLFVVGTLIHNSFIVPALCLAILSQVWSSPWLRRHFVVLVIFLLSIGYATGYLLVYVVSDSIFALSSMKDDGGISSAVLAFDGLLFLTSFVGVLYFKDDVNFHAKCSLITVLFLALYGGILMGAHELTLFLLRFYFYIEWFRVIGVITIVWFIVHHLKKPFAVLMIIPISFLMLEMRVVQSPFDYGGDVFEHLSGSIFWWVENLGSVAH